MRRYAVRIRTGTNATTIEADHERICALGAEGAMRAIMSETAEIAVQVLERGDLAGAKRIRAYLAEIYTEIVAEKDPSVLAAIQLPEALRNT